MNVERRELFALLAITCVAALPSLPRGLVAEDSIHILKSGDVERLRMDFNASRSKIRLLLLLSPT